MFMRYPAQLQAKQHQIQKALNGLISPDLILPIKPAPQPLGYRNRAQLKTDGQSLGFIQAGSHALAVVDDCLALSDHNRATLRGLHELLPNPTWRPRRKQQWTTLDIDESVTPVSASINQRLPFQQANDAQNQFMREWLAGTLAPLSRQKPILELFAGSGNFTRVVADSGFGSITAVEGVALAVESLRALHLAGVSAQVADLFSPISVSQLAQTQADVEVLVLDPPRDGFRLADRLVSGLRKLTHIIYISCDLATFRRDADAMVACGFIVRAVQPVDLFPQTPHTETLAVFERAKNP